MNNPGERLEHAIKLAGHETVADFARKIDVEPGTLRQQINRGSIPYETAAKCVRELNSIGLTVEWLLNNRGAPPKSPLNTVVPHRSIGQLNGAQEELRNDATKRNVHLSDSDVTLPPLGDGVAAPNAPPPPDWTRMAGSVSV